jgi:PAS domain S-box-containing protein
MAKHSWTPHSTRGWLRCLVAAVLIDAVFASCLRVRGLVDVSHGDVSVRALVGAAGMMWLAVVVVTAAGATRALHRLAMTVPDDQVIASVGSACHEWLWEADLELRLTYCSPAVMNLLGYTPQQLLGQAIPLLIAPESEQCCRRMLGAAIATRSGWRDRTSAWRHADGYLVTLQGSALPIVNEIGDVLGFRGARRAATDESSAEDSLTAARHRISQVLTDGGFDVALQPIVNVYSGRLVGAEALARFHDGRGPDRWFAEARMTGQSLELERATLFAALETMDQLPEHCYLSVNASPELSTDPEFRHRLLDGSTDLERLVVEITEHVAIDGYDDIRNALLPLRERGLRLAVDDTGAGYASFSHVLQLRPDIIKVDRSLIASLADDPARRSLVTAMVILALDLNSTVIAEGVETLAELDVLATLAVDHAQGYFLARPTTDPPRWATWHDQVWPTPSALAGQTISLPESATAPS